jgi:hypothetical protein
MPSELSVKDLYLRHMGIFINPCHHKKIEYE